MSTLEKAILIATKTHKGQVDKAGEPYILHPLRVMMSVNSLEEKIVAVLHDVIEDSDMLPTYLFKFGFSEEIIDALEYLTKRKGEKYQDFIIRVSDNRLATIVKLADLNDNMNLSRIKNPTDEDFARAGKYRLAHSFLRRTLS